MAANLPEWSIKSELILNSNCTVFCSCVVSLGKHPPTEGHCPDWAGVQMAAGDFDGASPPMLKTGLLKDIPGNMGRGNRKAATYADKRVSEAAYDGLPKTFRGKVRGTMGLFSIMVPELLCAERALVKGTTDGKTRRFMVGEKFQGGLTPITGANSNQKEALMFRPSVFEKDADSQTRASIKESGIGALPQGAVTAMVAPLSARGCPVAAGTGGAETEACATGGVNTQPEARVRLRAFADKAVARMCLHG